MAHFFSLHTMQEMILFAVLALNRSESIQGLECDQKLNLYVHHYLDLRCVGLVLYPSILHFLFFVSQNQTGTQQNARKNDS